jgi:CDP-glycerol glycerophosphotransferase (TagB/SpsB family)
MLRADRTAVRRSLKWNDKDAYWLWLPTYRGALPGGRGGDTVGSPNGLPFDQASLKALDEQLALHRITLVLKPHPLASVHLLDHGHGLRVIRQPEIESSGISLYQMLAAADGLVTDASSVWIDYLLTQRPIIFAFPDLEEYRQRRGLNLEPYEDWAPGPIAHDYPSLVTFLRDFSLGSDPYVKRRSDRLRQLHLHDDASSADRLLDLLGL